MTMWYGDIQGIETEDDVELLQEMGVKFEDESRTMGTAPVSMTQETFEKLDPYWGQFIWSLHRLTTPGPLHLESP